MPVPNYPLCSDCTECVAEARKTPKRVWGSTSPESFFGKLLGKRRLPEEESSHEISRPTIANVIYPNCDGDPRPRKIKCTLCSIDEDKHDPHGSLPAPKRRKVSRQKEHVATSRRHSPTRTSAKSESKKRHMKMRYLYRGTRREESNCDPMDLHHTGSSPPISNKPCTVSSTINSAQQQDGLSPPISQPSPATPTTPKTISTAEEVSALIPPGGITPTEFMVKAGLARCGQAKMAEIQLLWKKVARLERGKLYPKPINPVGGDIKKEGTAMTAMATPSPVTSTPSAPAMGAGYSTSSKACQPQKRTSTQPVQQPSTPAPRTHDNVFLPRKAKPKKQTPTPGLNILMKQANAAEGPRIPGLTLLEQASNGPKPKLFPQPSQATKKPHQPSVEDMDEDEEL